MLGIKFPENGILDHTLQNRDHFLVREIIIVGTVVEIECLFVIECIAMSLIPCSSFM